MGHSRIIRIAAPVSGAEFISVSVPSFPGVVPMSTAPFVFPGAEAAGFGPEEKKMRGEI